MSGHMSYLFQGAEGAPGLKIDPRYVRALKAFERKRAVTMPKKKRAKQQERRAA